MKKKIIYIALFLLLFSNLSFSEKPKFVTGNDMDAIWKELEKNAGDNILLKAEFKNLKENRLNNFFKAVRMHNNKYALTFIDPYNLSPILDIDENYYGPNVSEISLRKDSPLTKLVSVNSKNEFGYSPIIVAIEAKNNEILKALIERGANIEETHPVFGKAAIHTAVYFENEEAVEMILEKNKEMVNLKSGTDGWSPIEDAVLKENIKILKLLLENGADPLQKDFNGNTAIDMATKFGKGEAVKILRDHIKNSRKN